MEPSSAAAKVFTSLANGRSVVKIRVRAIAEGGEANRAVMELLAKALGVTADKLLEGVADRPRRKRKRK